MRDQGRRRTLARLVGLLLIAAVAASGCSGTRHSGATSSGSTSAPAPAWDQLLTKIQPDGSVSRDTALAAFDLAIGPLPGVATPPGTPKVIQSGTIAVGWLMRYWSTLTPAQQQAARRALSGAPAKAGSTDIVAPSATVVGAVYLGPTTPQPSPSADDPDVPCSSNDGAGAATYRPILDTVIQEVASHLGRPLRLHTYLIVDGKAYKEPGTVMYSYPCSDSDKSGSAFTGCGIHITPFFFQRGSDATDLLANFTHEVMHCFLYDLFGPTEDLLPDWLSEGTASWASATLANGGAVNSTHWHDYLINDTTSLFERSYDAIGFYAHLEETGTDVWSRIDAMETAYLNTLSTGIAADTAAWQVAAPTDEFLDTWGSSYLLGQRPGSQWTMNGPAIPLGPKPDVPVHDVDNVTVDTTQAAVGAPNLVQLNLAAEVVMFTGDEAAKGLLGTSDGSDLPLASVLGQTFCTRGDACMCPDGTANAGTTLPPIAGGAAYLGVTGGLTAVSVVASGVSLDDFCKKPNGNNARIAAIEKAIIATSNSNDTFVEFHDVSDLSKDGIDRGIQLSCGPGTGCIMVVLCNDANEPTCNSIADTLEPMGFHQYSQDSQALSTDPTNLQQGSPHDFAIRVEDIFLHVLGASNDYKLTWKSAIRPTAPLPTS